MRRNNLKALSIILIIVTFAAFSACAKTIGNDVNSSQNAGIAEEYLSDGTLKLTGLDQNFEVAYNDIFKMEAESVHMKTIDSKNQETEMDVTGIPLNSILNGENLSQKDFEVIRLIAGDGYEIDVPKEIFAKKDIILVYKINGKPLGEKEKPIRAAINEERSMYYVSNLIEIHFSKGENQDEEVITEKNTSALLIETLSSQMELYDYKYSDADDKAIKIKELAEEYAGELENRTKFIAADGFEKTEDTDVLLQGYLKMTGENKPLFTAPDLPKGMQVKNILAMDTGKVNFLSADHAMVGLSNKDINGESGIPLEEVVNLAGIDADTYKLTATDGYSVELEKDKLTNGILYKNSDGIYCLKFDESIPESYNLKDFLMIEKIK